MPNKKILLNKTNQPHKQGKNQAQTEKINSLHFFSHKFKQISREKMEASLE